MFAFQKVHSLISKNEACTVCFITKNMLCGEPCESLAVNPIWTWTPIDPGARRCRIYGTSSYKHSYCPQEIIVNVISAAVDLQIRCKPIASMGWSWERDGPSESIVDLCRWVFVSWSSFLLHNSEEVSANEFTLCDCFCTALYFEPSWCYFEAEDAAVIACIKRLSIQTCS